MKSVIAILVSGLFLSGCSGSGGEPAQSNNGSPMPNSVDTEMNDLNAELSSMADADILNGVTDEPSVGDTNDADELVIDEDSDSAMGGSQPDPMTLISTDVDFQISVPAHMSKQLQLAVTWGSKDIATQWVGDEFWSASATLPTDATLLLTITFTDINGDVVLAVYEDEFKTGINAAQTLEISAAQFETEQWDDDGDGVSNLSESIAGTNPKIIEMDQLDILDTYYEKDSLLGDVGLFEEKLAVLPYVEQSETTSPRPGVGDTTDYVSSRINNNVDATGTGTFDDYSFFFNGPSDSTRIEHKGTRTNTGESINYDVSWERYNSSAGVGSEWTIKSDTVALDAQTRTQTATVYQYVHGTGNGYQDTTTYTLTGKTTGDSAGCTAEYGVLTYVNDKTYVREEPNTTTLSKSIDDEYWNITTTTPNGSVVEEYLVQSLGREFHCGLVGL